MSTHYKDYYGTHMPFGQFPKFGVLSSVKVLMTGTNIAGPFAASIMAEMGAQVVQVESPNMPCQTRGNYGYSQDHRNTYSITLNTRTAKGKEVLEKLIAWADIWIESGRPGTYAKNGLSDEHMWKINRKLAIVHVSGYGQTGPDKNKAAYDVSGQAMGGYMYMNGTSPTSPEWDSTKCIQCNQCAYVCPHATIRPFALTADELAAAPAQTKAVDFKVGAGKGVYKFSMAISPLDCMGCGVCTHVCPVGALTMQPLESQEDQQPVFDYMVAKVAEKKELQDFTVKGSQFRQPMLEFSGSCAGCAETSYARLITQLFGDHMMISNATGCSSIWGGPAATSPYTVNKEGKGPAWANSLFEDNAEHGLGMYLGQKKIRDDLAEDIRYIAENGKDPAKVAAAKKYLETYNDGEANQTATAEFLAVMEAKPACDCERYQRIMTNKDFLNKKSCWIFGGDGWAYDIGFGGLDHVLAQDEDVNVFVFNTEVYSNTGGQASKASNIGQVAQFAAAGKELKSKSLAEIAMSYGYIYVAQVAMGANPAQTIKAIKEAEAYPGPSLIIGYAPCEMHSIKKGGMTNCQGEMKRAVDCGYWNLFRYDPSAEKPFALDSKEPAGGYRDFLMNEARYARLTNEFPERAEELFAKSEANAKVRYEHLLKLKQLYDEA